MNKYRISIVSYSNSLPFLYGITHSGFLKNNEYVLTKDNPAECADRIIKGEADIALIPVAELNRLEKYEIIPGYCIRAEKEVASVLLVSNSPLDKIKKLYLDYQSRSSNNMLLILLRDFWKINPEILMSSKGYEKNLKENEAALIIGDRAMIYGKDYLYRWDICSAWEKYSKGAYVTAVWTQNTKVDNIFLKNFIKALEYGINHISESIEGYEFNFDVLKYLQTNIRYDLRKEDIQAIDYFLKKINTILK